MVRSGSAPAGASFERNGDGTTGNPRSLLVRADRIHGSFRPGAPEEAHDALLVHGGRVVATGRAAALANRAVGARVLDLRGCTITPGFTDAHIHLIEWAHTLREPDLTGMASPRDAADVVARSCDAMPDDRWVTGHGWSGNRWGTLPGRQVLDTVFPDRPVVLRSQDMHALWVNSAALAACGIRDDTPDPDGGVIVRDASGQPTGVLLESAMALVVNRMPRAPDRTIADVVRAGQAALHALGITGVHAFPGVYGVEPGDLRILQLLIESDELRLRVLQQLPERVLDEAISLGLRSGAGGEWVRIGGLKLFLDGSLGSRTAWLREAYLGTDDTGIALYAAEKFRAVVRRAAEAGISSTVHAIGDAAVDLALDVLTDPELPRAPLPHRIEHMQLCAPERFGEAAAAGVVQSVQPAHLMTDWVPAERLWGHPRCRGAYAFRSLRSGGILLAFGSDGPVADPDPRLGLHAATARQDVNGDPAGGWYPEERLTTREALWSCTGAPAVAAGLAGVQGELRPGAWADFAAWDRDPARLHGRDFLDLACQATVVGGHLVWRAS